MALEYKALTIDGRADTIDRLLSIYAADRWRVQSMALGILDSCGNVQNRGCTVILERDRSQSEVKAVPISAELVA